MKRQKKQLSLNKVTVTRLDATQMGRVNGGETVQCESTLLDCNDTIKCTIGCSVPTCPGNR